MKKENPRMDIVSRKRYPKDMLFRFVISSGLVRLGEDGLGRGFYLLKDPSSIETFFRKRLYSRFGKIEDEAALREELYGKVK